MNDIEYRAALAALRLNQRSAAYFLGIDERTSRRWAAGDKDVPHAIALLLRVMIAFGISPRTAREIAQRKPQS